MWKIKKIYYDWNLFLGVYDVLTSWKEQNENIQSAIFLYDVIIENNSQSDFSGGVFVR